MAERMSAALALLGAIAAGGAAIAQGGLADPTRPPSVIPQVESAGGTAAPAQAARQLQSVLISGTRKLAVIDGKTVALGEKIDGATLVEVAETGVTLRRGEEVQTLRMHPNVQWGPARAAADPPHKKGTAP